MQLVPCDHNFVRVFLCINLSTLLSLSNQNIFLKFYEGMWAVFGFNVTRPLSIQIIFRIIHFIEVFFRIRSCAHQDVGQLSNLTTIDYFIFNWKKNQFHTHLLSE